MHHRQAGAALLGGAQAQGAASSCQRCFCSVASESMPPSNIAEQPHAFRLPRLHQCLASPLRGRPHLTMLTDIDEVISFTRDLVRIRSVNDTQSNGEANVAARVMEEATRLGLHAEIIAADQRKPNVLVTVGTIDGPLVLLFVAHSDTVELGDASRWSHDPLSGYIDNAGDRLYGRGACDNKGGIAVALATLARLKKWQPDEFDGRVQLAVVADEESGACSDLGLRHLLNTGAIKSSDRCRGSIYAYPGWTVTIGHRGVVRLVIEVKGSPLHTGSRDWAMKRKGCSAVTALCEMVWRIETEPWPTETSEGFPELPLTITPGTLLQGGAFESIVPESASCLVDIRIPPDPKGGADAIVGRVETIVDEVMNRRNRLAGSDPSCLVSASIRRKVDIPPYQIPSTHPLAIACRDAVTQVTGICPEVRGCGPANEGYMLFGSGIPCICGFGPKGGNPHGIDEYLEVGKSLEQTLDIYEHICKWAVLS